MDKNQNELDPMIAESLDKVLGAPEARRRPQQVTYDLEQPSGGKFTDRLLSILVLKLIETSSLIGDQLQDISISLVEDAQHRELHFRAYRQRNA